MIVVPARTGLAGHPSDAFGGAVLAAPIEQLTAIVTAGPADDVVVGDRRFADLAALCASEHHGESALLTAAVARLTSWMRTSGVAPPSTGFTLTWRTTIPRSVGLAGSSALVVGALRSLAAMWGIPIADVDGPRLALEVEADVLGIAAGPQDRLVQWHATTLLMDFAAEQWSVQPVRPPEPIELLVCWSDTPPHSSDATHAPLQARRGDRDVRERMATLAAIARDAASALEAGDIGALGTCMDTGFEHRRALVPLDPSHVALVDAMRGLGAAATYTGSGGAVVALAVDVAPLRDWVAARGLRSVTTTLG
jgi:glucuronokinase